MQSAPKQLSLWDTWKRRFNGANARESLDRRRALRLPVRMPVWIYGWLEGEPFAESSETINVCVVGGLIPIAANVRRLQKLILKNLQTSEEVTCRVARIEKEKGGRKLAGIEFLQFGGSFWRTRTLAREQTSAAP